MKHLSDDQLEMNLRSLITRERELLHEILLHIREVDRRRLFLKRARPNLFEYLTLDMGYGAASAQRRIDASRLVRELPEVLEKIKDGRLNLSQVSLLQKAVRQKEKTQSVDPGLKREILGKIENQSNRESEKIIAQGLDMPILSQTKTSVQKDESIRIEITLSKEDFENLKRCQELEGGNAAEVFAKLLKARLAKKDPLKKPPPITSAAERISASSQRKYDSILKRRFIFQRDRVCQYRDEHGKICGSQYRLEIDHIRPVSQGGTDEVSNLRVMCPNHNKYLALQMLGKKVMQPYLKL